MGLKRLKERVFYAPNPVNIGVVCTSHSTVLIDSGIDESVAKKLCRELEKPVRFVINTHSHADHCGGNFYLRKQFSAKILAPRIESHIIEDPILEPFYLFGASPPEQLRTKFLMAKPCTVDGTLEEGPLQLEDVTLNIVPLAGHSVDQIGVAVDNVLFCGDAFFSESAIEKHRIFVVYDVKKFLETLDLLSRSDYDLYVPSHGEATSDIKDVLAINRKTIEDVVERILKLLKTPLTAEGLLKELLDAFNVRVENLVQFVLYRSTVHAYLSYLLSENMVETVFRENVLLWKVRA